MTTPDGPERVDEDQDVTGAGIRVSRPPQTEPPFDVGPAT
jgi:hypothetical protein